MGSPLTTGSGVECGHQGTVAVMSAAKLTVGGQPVLVATDVAGKPVVACTTAPGPSTKPCTTVLSVLPTSLALKLTAGKMGVVLDRLAGVTDGVPPGALAASARQSKLTAA